MQCPGMTHTHKATCIPAEQKQFKERNNIATGRGEAVRKRVER